MAASSSVSTRRFADPHIVQQLWEAITAIRSQKQVANVDRIMKYMTRAYGIPVKETQQQLIYATKDELVVKDNSVAKKGKCAGQHQDAYWCAAEQEEESDESHDWYCCKCQAPGEVLCCATCYRVYHPECLGLPLDGVGSAWTCAMCKAIKSPHLKLSVSMLYKVLIHVLNRMKDKARDLHKKINLRSLPNYYNLVYRHVDLATIMQKVDDKQYHCIEEFQSDAEMMVHTSVIYYGSSNERTDLCQLTLNDCNYDLAEVQLCKDCYLMSNCRTNDGWFCKPCDPTHEVVWAQMKGFGYWPAKVLQRLDGNVDVRFFGSRHQRAWIPEDKTKDISTSHSKLSIKATQGWRKAWKELQTYRARVDSKQTSSERRTKHKRKHDDDNDNEDEEEADDKEDDRVSSSYSEGGQVERKQSRLQDHSVSTSQASPGGVPIDDTAAAIALKKEHSSSGSQPATPNPPSPNPTSPNPTSPNPASPNPTSPNPASPNPASPNPTSPNPASPNPTSPNPTALQAFATPPSKKRRNSMSIPERLERPADPEQHNEMPQLPKIPDNQKEEEEDREEGEEEEEEGEMQEMQRTVLKTCNCEEMFATLLADKLAQAQKEHQKTLDKTVKEELKKVKEEFKAEKEKALAQAKETARLELERCQQERDEEIEKLKNKHKEEVSSTKKRQWCINCEQEAMYHCCWNTSYCSINCQQSHWHKEHKRLCRRKR